MKLYQFNGNILYRGVNLRSTIICKTVNDAAKMLNVTTYHIRTYFSKMQPNPADELAFKNPYLRCARFEHSGEAPYFVPKELINKWIKWVEAVAIIDEHRKECPGIKRCKYYSS